MLYQLYETQRALMSPFSEFASATSKLYSHPSSPFTHFLPSQRVAAGFESGAPPDEGIREAGVRHHLCHGGRR